MSNITIVSNFDEMMKLANAFAKSGLFGMTKPEEALSLMAIAHAEGYSPALAARDYHIIKGKPTLKADAMLARFQQSGGRVKWHQYTDEVVSATFSHPQGGEITLDWTIERAKRAGITGNPTWQKYPRNMLRSRVISEAVRTIFPGVGSVGIYTPEEMEDMNVQENQPIRLTNSKPTIEQVAKLIEIAATPDQILELKEKSKCLNEEQVKRVFDYFKISSYEELTESQIEMFNRYIDKQKAGDKNDGQA